MLCLYLYIQNTPPLSLLLSLSLALSRLFDHYMMINQKLVSQTWPTKILYHVGAHEAVLGWVGVELHCHCSNVISCDCISYFVANRKF